MRTLKVPVNFHTTGYIRRSLFQLMAKDIEAGIIDQDRLSLNEQIVKALRDRYSMTDETEPFSHGDDEPIEMSIRLPPEVHEALMEEAKQHRKDGNKELKSINKIINVAIEQKLAKIK